MSRSFPCRPSWAPIYRGIGVGIAINPAKWKGIYKDYEFNLNYYSNRFSIDFSYQRSESLTGDIHRNDVLSQLQSGDVTLKVTNVAGYYTFNHRCFSFPAAFTQSYIQRQSAGSWLGAVQEVTSYIRETVQTAQMDGEVTDVYPKIGELVGTGTPIMSIAVMDDAWATFNIREDQLKNVKVGSEITVEVPALDKELKMKVYFMKDKGSFAVWKATKASGQYDQKTFEVKARPMEKLVGVRPGMSVIMK